MLFGVTKMAQNEEFEFANPRNSTETECPVEDEDFEEFEEFEDDQNREVMIDKEIASEIINKHKYYLSQHPNTPLRFLTDDSDEVCTGSGRHHYLCGASPSREFDDYSDYYEEFGGVEDDCVGTFKHTNKSSRRYTDCVKRRELMERFAEKAKREIAISIIHVFEAFGFGQMPVEMRPYVLELMNDKETIDRITLDWYNDWYNSVAVHQPDPSKKQCGEINDDPELVDLGKLVSIPPKKMPTPNSKTLGKHKKRPHKKRN